MAEMELEEFAEALIRFVRDNAVDSCLNQLNTSSNTPLAKRWQLALENKDPSSYRDIVPDIVDEAIFFLLEAIDERSLKLMFKTKNGEVLDLGESGKGEMGGWYMASGGWRSKFSKQPFFDYFADLNP
jgi:hypothetical protein